MKVLRNVSSFSCTNHSTIINVNKYYDLFRYQNPTQTLSILHHQVSLLTEYMSRQKAKVAMIVYLIKILIIASTLPVITAGNLKASTLQCLSILFMSSFEIVSEGAILPQRLRFCQIIINGRTHLDLLCFVAFSQLRRRNRPSLTQIIRLEII